MDNFCQQNCFSDTCSTEESDLPAFKNRAEEIKSFNTCDENFFLQCDIFIWWRIAVNRPFMFADNLASSIYGVPEEINNSAQNFFTNRYGYRFMRVNHICSPS